MVKWVSIAIISALILIVLLLCIAEGNKSWAKRFSKYGAYGTLVLSAFICSAVCFGFLKFYTNLSVWIITVISIPSGIGIFLIIVILHFWNDKPSK